MGELLDAGNTPGRPKIEEDHVLGEIAAQLVRPAGEVIQGEIGGFLGLHREGTEKAQAGEEPKKNGKGPCSPRDRRTVRR